MTFGEKLKSLRAEKGLTQAQLAELADTARESIARLETGSYEPSWKTVQDLAAALGVDCTAFSDAGPPATTTKPSGRKPPRKPQPKKKA